MSIKTNTQIFIIDDDPFWATMLLQILETIGYTNVVTYDNGSEGLSNLKLNPRLIFLDYQMDGINGLEVLKLVKDYDSGINVIFCTANQDLSVALNAMQFGSFDYLLKENATKKEVSSIIDNVSNR